MSTLTTIVALAFIALSLLILLAVLWRLRGSVEPHYNKPPLPASFGGSYVGLDTSRANGRRWYIGFSYDQKKETYNDRLTSSVLRAVKHGTAGLDGVASVNCIAFDVKTLSRIADRLGCKTLADLDLYETHEILRAYAMLNRY